VKFLIMIHTNPLARAMWESFSEEDRAVGYGAYAALTEELMTSGEYVASAQLADPETSRRVGAPLATDGPFAEVKEYLAGFYLVDCDSMERALEVAAKVPGAEDMGVEVRPVLDNAAMDM
jgi:hypothetical protein